jgi:hypothetical protein
VDQHDYMVLGYLDFVSASKHLLELEPYPQHAQEQHSNDLNRHQPAAKILGCVNKLHA